MLLGDDSDPLLFAENEVGSVGCEALYCVHGSLDEGGLHSSAKPSESCFGAEMSALHSWT